MSERDQREHNRYSGDISGILAVGDTRVHATVRNVSKGGVLVETQEFAPAPRKTNIRLTMIFQGGVEIKLSGVVRWFTEESAGQPPFQYGVKFFALSQGEKEVIENYVKYRNLSQTERALSSNGNQKEYDLQVSDEGCIWLEFNGELSMASARTLCIDIRAWTAGLSGDKIIMILDATHYVPSAEESIGALVGCFKDFTQKTFFGSLVGPNSIGMLQILNLVRDSDLAGGIVSFETAQEAEDFIKETDDFGPAWHSFNRLPPG
ncbi:PilZ domain-containing protein [Myxococcota bacterium]|nr:PilZ domain-containing protein [Myxococcota bacterium]